jgi:hypothetical protein
MKTVLPGAVMLLIVLSGALGYPGAPLALYDDFNAKLIDPGRWFGAELGPVPAGAGGEAGTEAIRRIQDHQLRLLYRAYGRTDSNSKGTRRDLALILRRNAAAVTAIQATVKVTAVAATGCPNNSEPMRARARLSGHFFAAPNGGVLTDVLATIFLGRSSDPANPPNVLRVRAEVFHCDDLPCTNATELVPAQTIGDVKLGKTARLRVQWDQGTHRFIFQHDNAKEVVMPYTVTDTDPPRTPAKLLTATLSVPNCTATMPPTPRPVAFIDARFDDVRVIH